MLTEQTNKQEADTWIAVIIVRVDIECHLDWIQNYLRDACGQDLEGISRGV